MKRNLALLGATLALGAAGAAVFDSVRGSAASGPPGRAVANVKEDTREEVRTIEDEIRRLQMDQRKIQAEVRTLTENLAYMMNVERFVSGGAKDATEKGKLDSQEIMALSKYLMEGRSDKARQL